MWRPAGRRYQVSGFIDWREAMLHQELFGGLSYGQAARLSKGEVDVLVCGKSCNFLFSPQTIRF